jgi:hypothetical protein
VRFSGAAINFTKADAAFGCRAVGGSRPAIGDLRSVLIGEPIIPVGERKGLLADLAARLGWRPYVVTEKFVNRFASRGRTKHPHPASCADHLSGIATEILRSLP